MTGSAASQQELEFRRAEDADKPYLLDLRKLTMGEHIERAGLGGSEAEHMKRVEYRFDCAELVYMDGQRAGMIKRFREDGAIKILQVQVHPDFQGQGLGENVVRRVQEEAASAGMRVTLTVLKENPARRLYARLGFTMTGEDEYEYHMEWQPAKNS